MPELIMKVGDRRENDHERNASKHLLESGVDDLCDALVVVGAWAPGPQAHSSWRSARPCAR